MTREELVDRICAFMAGPLAQSAKSEVTKFILGAASAGAGRMKIAEAVNSMVPVNEAGCVELEHLKASVQAGFTATKKLPVLGGLISLDEGDADSFFAFLGT